MKINRKELNRMRARTKITKAQLRVGLNDLIRAPEVWESWYIERIARNARAEINRLRKELRARGEG